MQNTHNTPPTENFLDYGKTTVHGNKVRFWGGISQESVATLIEKLEDVIPHQPYIELWLNSGGGSAFEGMALADYITACPIPIHGIAHGWVASAATFSLISCHRRFITPSSFILIHQLSSISWGDQDKIEDEVVLLKKLKHRMIEIYTQRTKLTVAEVTAMLSRETSMSAKEAKRFGFVDSIRP